MRKVPHVVSPALAELVKARAWSSFQFPPVPEDEAVSHPQSWMNLYESHVNMFVVLQSMNVVLLVACGVLLWFFTDCFQAAADFNYRQRLIGTAIRHHFDTWGEHAYPTDKASDPSAKPSTAVGKKVEVPVLSRFGKENHNVNFKFQNFYFYVLYVCNLTAISILSQCNCQAWE